MLFFLPHALKQNIYIWCVTDKRLHVCLNTTLSAQIWTLSEDIATSFSLLHRIRSSVWSWEAHLQHNMQLVYPTHAGLQLWLNGFGL